MSPPCRAPWGPTHVLILTGAHGLWGGHGLLGDTDITQRSQKRVGGYSTDEMHEVSWWPDHLQCIAENITGALGSPFVERAGGAGILCCPVSVALAACGSLINSGEKIQFLIWTRCRSRSHVENSGRFLKKLKILLPLDPAIPLLGLYPSFESRVPRRCLSPCSQQHSSQEPDAQAA